MKPKNEKFYHYKAVLVVDAVTMNVCVGSFLHKPYGSNNYSLQNAIIYYGQPLLATPRKSRP
ncbi:MAG: hypothetical protein Q8807_04145 ['Waltheria sp.' little leaf phytoplasma]|nr:hypothetical protein ['Waltheria sp.' little leaf phytoplasma]